MIQNDVLANCIHNGTWYTYIEPLIKGRARQFGGDDEIVQRFATSIDWTKCKDGNYVRYMLYWLRRTLIYARREKGLVMEQIGEIGVYEQSNEVHEIMEKGLDKDEFELLMMIVDGYKATNSMEFNRIAQLRAKCKRLLES